MLLQRQHFLLSYPCQLSCCLPIQISPDVPCLLGFLWSFARLHLLALIALFAWTALLLRAASFLRSLFFDGHMTVKLYHVTVVALLAFDCSVILHSRMNSVVRAIKIFNMDVMSLSCSA